MKIFLLMGGLLLALATNPKADPVENMALATESAPGLWQKAVTLFAENAHLFPGQVRTTVSILDGKGRTKKTFSSEMRYFLDDQGKIQSELVWARENGRDITAKTKVEREQDEKNSSASQGKGGRMIFSLSDVPFDPEKQGQAEVSPRSETASLFGRTCRRFDFFMSLPLNPDDSAKGKPVTMRGMVWIDEAGGAPVKLEYAPDPLPSKVKSLWTVFTYGPGPHGEWLLKEIASDGVGGILFIKRRFRSRVELGDYFPVPKASHADSNP